MDSGLTGLPSLWLKSVTKREHEATEASAFARDMACGRMALSGYVALLYAYAELWADLEDAARRHGFSRLLANPSKSARAAADVAALDVRPADIPEPIRAGVTAFCTAGALSSPHALLGRLYVFEGSALGSAMLLPVVARSLGLSRGLSYFEGHGRETMPRFARFRAELDVMLDAPERRELARAAADQAFCEVRKVFEILSEHAHDLRFSAGLRTSPPGAEKPQEGRPSLA